MRRLLLMLATVALSVAVASGVALAETWVGDDGPNNHQGTADNDDLSGRGGNDLLVGMGGADEINGGDDNDDLYGGRRDAGMVTGTNTVVGGYGKDEIWGDDGADELRGGPHDDTIHDSLQGDQRVDTIYGNEGQDAIDTVSDPAARDEILACGGGPDTVYADYLDVVANDCETVYIYGGSGDDTIEGTSADDHISGLGGSDSVSGLDGNDELNGDAGSDTLRGGLGNDVIRGGDLEEAATDTIYGDGGDDTIYTPNLPASRDVVHCGEGIDTVTVDSLDETTANCEDVDRIQETEPRLEPGVVYELQPSPSSECDVGRGTLTVGTDPDSGERGLEMSFRAAGVGSATRDAAQTSPCEVDVNYNSATTTQSASAGEVGTASSGSGTISYEGEEILSPEANMPPPDDTEPVQPAPTTQEGEVSAQATWRWSRYHATLRTADPIGVQVARTYSTLGWHYNGYNVAFGSKYKNCTARTNPQNRWPRTHWYIGYCLRASYDHWFDGNGSVRWIGTRVNARYYNFDWRNDSRGTSVYHYLWVYGNGYGNGSAPWDVYRYGEDYWLLGSWVVRGYGY